MSAPTELQAVEFDMDDGDYRKAPGLSSTGLKHLLDSPARFQYERTHRTDKKAFDIGHAVHQKVLGAGLPIAVIPAETLASNGAASTKEAKAFIAEARAEGKTPIKPDEAAVIDRMVEAVLANDDARVLLEAPGDSEVSLFWNDSETGVELKGRIDRLLADAPFALDLKTTGQSAKPSALAAYGARLGWEVQSVHYLDGVERVRGLHRFIHVVVETAPPHLVAVVELDADFLSIGETRRRAAIDLYARCVERDEWPGYGEGVHRLAPPRWHRANDIDPEES